MEFQEALMKLVIHKTPAHHKAFFQEVSGKEKEREEKVATGAVNTKQKWRISFHRSSSNNKVSKTSQAQQKETPKEFCCPISGSLMADPVIVFSGHTFERACVEACKTLEFTPTLRDGSIPDFSTIIPNLALKSAIFNWCQNHSLNPPKPLNLSTAEELVRTLIAKNPNTQIKKEEEKVSTSVEELIQGVKDSPSVKLDQAVTELIPRPIHFHSSSEESVAATAITTTTNVVTPPLQLATRPSCYSSASSSSEIEILAPNLDEEEEFFLTKLKSPQVFDVEEALVALRKITRTQESSRVVLCTPRVLSAFRSLIISRYVNIQVNSVAVLVNLSLEKVNKVKIVRSGLVPDLIDVLKAGSPEAQEHACGALFSLALVDDNKTAIGFLGALQPLMHMLRSGTERARHDSASALYHLSLVRSNKSKLIKLGSVPVLLNMVKSGHMTGRVLIVLCNLGSDSDGRAAMMDSGGVECLVSLLKESEVDESTREGCVSVLYVLSHGGLRFKGLAIAAGAVEELVKLERMGSQPAREKARRMLEMLKARSKEEQEDADWEELLDSGLMSRTRFRFGGAMNGSCVNSSEF
ncbi:LOW QUALITY PROTEIN: U-box domain-containing protein 40-like [Durio zibethinus]|uniref:RING-type E3 ubiquitin transferase n=1 Tax=Durio zibethinus TaxID=66656 RepID=A0A6P5ZHB9_DURZI|nr:LOW QUALITY PROTEIN: U-box domain-containing protein 40-like [Durio zibethinus]